MYRIQVKTILSICSEKRKIIDIFLPVHDKHEDYQLINHNEKT